MIENLLNCTSRVEIFTPNESFQIFAKHKKEAFIKDINSGDKCEAWEYVGVTIQDFGMKSYCQIFVIPKRFIAEEIELPDYKLPSRIQDNPVVVVREDGQVEIVGGADPE